MNAESAHRVRTLILGAGFAGLGMGAQLRLGGDDDFVILEREDGIGGVWLNNVYPGAACDTEAHLYCYGFFPHLRVSRMYAGRGELLDYLHRLAEAYDLNRHVRTGTELVSARWDAGRWHLETRDGRRYEAEFFVPAWGQLNKPLIPHFPGLETFRGAGFHSAVWDPGLELTGKRVASVGNAASAVQYVPEIAPVVETLTVFQRSANWILPRNQVVFTPEQLDAFERDPASFEASRERAHAFRESGFRRTQHDTEEQAEGMRIALAHLAAQVPDPELRAVLTPDYEYACKRVLRSDDYYPALSRPNVRLETSPIRTFDADGVVTADGRRHGFDVVIFGTGFESQSFQGDLRVTGSGGASLADAWSDGPEAYLGLTVPRFPNMFMLYGPNTNLNHNSIITMLEIQQRYVVDAIAATAGGRRLSVREDVFRRYNEVLQGEMRNSAFSSGCSSWYKNAAGKVINNWSGTVEAYRRAASFDPADYEIA